MNTVRFLGKTYDNPVVLASGVLGVTASSWANVVRHGAGGITIKSCSLEPREGHANPTMTGSEHYFLNAVGLSNPGAREVVKEVETFRKNYKTPLIGSVFGGSVEEFGQCAEILGRSAVDFIEIDISCPNVKKEFGEPYAYSPEATKKITAEVKKRVKQPVITKLSADAPDMVAVGKAAEKAGADALCAINTISGMAISAEMAAPILSNVQGGVSGPAIKPMAVKAVWDLYENLKIPIIGTGGVTYGLDAVEMLMAGATLVGVGSAVYYRDMGAFKLINDEINDFMKKNGYKTIKSMIGEAHK